MTQPIAHEQALQAVSESDGPGMFHRWPFWVAMGSIASVVAVLGFGFFTNPREVPSPLVGKQAPAFSAERLGGGTPVSLQDLRGKPIVLNFWASWCVACREEAAVLEHAHQIFGVQGVQVVGIAVQDTQEKAQAFARRFGKTYLLSLDNADGEIGLNYGLYGVPETFFIDRAGIIRYKHIGAVTPDLLAVQVQALLEN